MVDGARRHQPPAALTRFAERHCGEFASPQALPYACRAPSASHVHASATCLGPWPLSRDMDWTDRASVPNRCRNPCENPCQTRPTIMPQVVDYPNTSACPIRAKSVPDETRIWPDLAQMDDAEMQCFRGFLIAYVARSATRLGGRKRLGFSLGAAAAVPESVPRPIRSQRPPTAFLISQYAARDFRESFARRFG